MKQNGNTNGVRIGWASRHIPLPAQQAELDRLFGKGNWELIPLVGSLPHGGFKDADEVIDLIRRNRLDYCVVILPMWFISKLLERLKALKIECPLLWARMEQVNDEFRPESDAIAPGGRHMRFREFRRIIKLELVTAPVTASGNRPPEVEKIKNGRKDEEK